MNCFQVFAVNLNLRRYGKMLKDPQYSVLKSKVDLELSHIAFSQNCAMLWKKPAPESESEPELTVRRTE